MVGYMVIGSVIHNRRYVCFIIGEVGHKRRYVCFIITSMLSKAWEYDS